MMPATFRMRSASRTELPPNFCTISFIRSYFLSLEILSDTPHLVPADCPIAPVDDVFNAIMIRGNAVGDVMFYGRGAGDLPTASAVMGDVLDGNIV